jgi:hypothetical protein
MRIRIIVAIAVLFITTNVTTLAQGPAPGSATGFAEGIYSQYSTATGGKVVFNVQTVGQGPLSDLAGKPFSTFLAEPTYRVESDQFGTELNNVRFNEPVSSDFITQDMSSLPDHFEDIGLPLQLGVYRRLGITATIGADSRSYQSMEFCWSSLSQCDVLDPVVVFLQSKVESRTLLVAAGWAKQVTYTLASNVAAGPSMDATAGVCGLASNPARTSQTFGWPSYTKKYYNYFHDVRVEKTLGRQSVTISCDTSCLPHPSSFSESSSGDGFLGWNVDCDNTPSNVYVGKTGSVATAIAETKCTHRWVESATASVSLKNGASASVSATWDLGGGVDSNGGRYSDSCSRFARTQ